MHFDRDTLIFKALVALDEVVARAGEAPIEPSYAIRFTLAWLYAVSNGERRLYDDFFRLLRDPMEREPSREQAAHIRATYLRNGVEGISRTVGNRDFSPEFFSALRHARLPKADRERCREDQERREKAVEAMRLAGSARAELEERRRRGRDCQFG